MQYLTDEELQLASRFLFLSMAIIVIEQDIQLVKEGVFKIKRPYLALLESMMTRATNERKKLRKKMKEKRIQIVTHHKNESFTSYLFICQGKEEERNYFNPVIQKKVEEIILELLQTTTIQYDHPSFHEAF